MPTLGTHPLATDVVFADQLQAGTFPRANDAGTLQVNSIGGAVISSGSALFDGDACLRANSHLSLAAPFTAALEYNPGSGSSTGRLLSITFGDADYFELLATGAGQIRARVRSGGSSVDSDITAGFAMNTWTAVAFVVTATTVQIWLGGTFGAAVSRTGITPSGSDSYITIGALTRGGGSTQDFLHSGARVRNVIIWQGTTNGAMTDDKLNQWAADPGLPYSSGAPVITGPSGTIGALSITHSVNENQNNAGTWSATGGTTWSLTGTDASLLSISSGGVVTLATGNFNREVKSTYSFNVLRDAVSQAVTLTINDVNEAPTFSGTITVPALVVGAAMTPVDFGSMFSDVDIGDTVAYSQIGTWPAGISISGTSIVGTPTTAGTSSNLRVRRTDSGSLTADSNLFTITVNAAGDTTNPVLTGVVTPSSVTSAGATISWSAGSDNVAVTGYEYRLNGGSYTSVGSVLTFNLSGLTPSTAYTVDVRAFDAAGNRSSAITGNFTTSAASDTTPPILTGSITIGTVTSSSIQFSWPAATDNVAVTGYEVSSNGGTSYTPIANVLSHNFTGLAASTIYGLRVRARDAAGNVSSALSASQSTSAPSVTTKRIVVVLTSNGTTPAASLTNLKWAFFNEARPDLMNAPATRGAIESTDASGVLEIDVSSSTLAIGQTGWLIITDSDGTITQNPPAKAFSAPVQVIE